MGEPKSSTKKSVKLGLKYALNAEPLKCISCREEMTAFLKDIGAQSRAGGNAGYNIRIENGHFVYKVPSGSHKGVPVKEPKKAEGSEVEDDEA
jgi:hypothetical protein